MDDQQEIVQIPESRLARWAYRLSLLPIVGLLLSPMLCFLAMLSIGKNGYSGLDLIWKTGVRLLILNVVAIAGLLYLWFLPRYVESRFRPFIGNEYYGLTAESGYEIRAFEWPARWIKHGPWKTKYTGTLYIGGMQLNIRERTFNVCGERLDTFSWGKQNGKSTTYHENGKKFCEGEYNNDNKIGKWKYWDEQGRLTGEEIYDSDGKLISEKAFATPTPSQEKSP
jgi:hypothetical protein